MSYIKHPYTELKEKIAELQDLLSRVDTELKNKNNTPLWKRDLKRLKNALTKGISILKTAHQL